LPIGWFLRGATWLAQQILFADFINSRDFLVTYASGCVIAMRFWRFFCCGAQGYLIPCECGTTDP